MARARVYKRLRRPNGALVTGSVGRRLGGNRTDVEVVVRNAKPLRAKFVFPDGFTAQDKFGNYTTLRNAPGESVYSFPFPYGPQDLKYDQFSPRFKEINRPYKKPLLVAESSSLRNLSFNAVIANRESRGKLSIIDLLERLEAIADSGAAFQFTYGLTALPFAVVLTKFSYTVSHRNLEGSPIRAEVSIQLTEAVSAQQELTILKAVHRNPSPTVAATIPSRAPAASKPKPPPPTPVNDPPRTPVWINPTTGAGYIPDATAADFFT
jgi:hypothetical protein